MWLLEEKTKNIWQPKVVELGLDVLRNPKTIEHLLDSSANLMEKVALRDRRAEGSPRVGENQSYKPITGIIQHELQKREKQGKPIVFRRVANYQGLNYYLDKFNKIVNDPSNRDRTFIETGETPASAYFLGYIPGTFENAITFHENGLFPPDVLQVWEASHDVFGSSCNLLVPGSGFADRTVRDLGRESEVLVAQYTKRGNEFYDYWTPNQELVNESVRKQLLEARKHIAEKVSENNGPVSAGVIFGYFIDQNEGDISKSLIDTAIFLKFMARQDTSFRTFDYVGYDPEATSANENWYKLNILDEYGRVGNYAVLPHETYPYAGILSYSEELTDREVDKDLHLLNQIGKPYHAWFIAFMLIVVPPEIAQVGVAWRQQETFSRQGCIKTSADFRIALDLPNLLVLLNQYKHS